MDISISGICERDMDLFLIEELASDSAVLEAVFARCGFGKPLYEKTVLRHSAMGGNGESDLEIRATLEDGTQVMILIENKVDAGFQRKQAERYMSRAADHVASGQVISARTLLFAPQTYLGGGGHLHGFDATLSYEDLLSLMGGRGQDLRMEHRCRLLMAAIDKSSRRSSSIVNEAAVGFHLFYWEVVQRRNGGIRMNRPFGTPEGSTFIQFAKIGLPKGFSICHKLDQGAVDLQISGAVDLVQELKSILGDALEPDMSVLPATKSAAIRLTVPLLNIARDPKLQEEAIQASISAAENLLAWFLKHQGRFETLPTTPSQQSGN